MSAAVILNVAVYSIPTPVAARSKARVYGRSLTGIACLNPAGTRICLLWLLCVVRQMSLRRADHSSREILPKVVFLSVISKSPQWRALGQQRLSNH